MDRIEKLWRSTIQHGPHSNRVYLMKLDERDMPGIVERIDNLALEKGYTKLFAKVPASNAGAFQAAGFCAEARIPGFFNGREDVLFMSRFLDDVRKTETDEESLDGVLELSRRRGEECGDEKAMPPNGMIRPCAPEDIHAMSEIYRDVFPTYPFPIDDPDFLLQTMKTHVAYFGVEAEGRLVALASAEMDEAAGNVEFTDFATLPKWRGQGLAVLLLKAMEPVMRHKGIQTGYTIARAVSAGMNIVFSKMGYDYGGRLVNNTNISGQIESMNVWYKSL